MLRAGESVQDFVVTTVDGSRIDYAALWQRKNVLLVSIPGEDAVSEAAYLSELTAHMSELTAHDTACVITRDKVDGVPRPGVLVADRWGEIHFVGGTDATGALPRVPELIEWLRYVQYQCPECQGEAR